MVKKILGYFIAALGLIGLATASLQEVRDLIPLSSSINDLTLTISSIIIILIGVFLVLKSPKFGKSKERDLPIYKGKEVIGYRRAKH